MRLVRVEVEAFVRERFDGWAATTTPFKITMYGDTQASARDRAFDAVRELLSRQDDASAYLKRRGVEHDVTEIQSLPSGTSPRIPQGTARFTDKLELAIAG